MHESASSRIELAVGNCRERSSKLPDPSAWTHQVLYETHLGTSLNIRFSSFFTPAPENAERKIGGQLQERATTPTCHPGMKALTIAPGPHR